MIKHDDVYYRQRKPKPEVGAFENFKLFLWDPKRKAFLDRTAQEWANVGFFYLCFFGVLFSCTGLQMWLTYKYVTVYDKPFFQYNKLSTRIWIEPHKRTMLGLTSLQLHGPGIVMKPNIIPNAKPALILLDESRETGQRSKYVDAIKQTLAEYRKVDSSKYDMACSDRVLHEKNPTESCFFDIQTLGSCSQEPFGYYTSTPQPCVYIKFNKRFAWTPIFYNQASFLPDDMPTWLQEYIRKSDKFYIWLSCEGKNEVDKTRVGEIEYLPAPGFPVQFFPFSGQTDYLPPIVALRFKNIAVNQLVNIECKTWARNIDNENRYNLNFRILIKGPKTE